MSMDNGVMKMRPVEGGIEIKPGETVTLKPGSDHLMLMNIKHPLEAGKTVEATLQFEKAGTVKVEFAILAMGAAAPGAPAGGGSMMMEGHGGRHDADAARPEVMPRGLRSVVLRPQADPTSSAR